MSGAVGTLPGMAPVGLDTMLRGRWLVAARLGWFLVGALALVTSVAAFITLFTGGGFRMLLDQGPLALNEDIEVQLERLFPAAFIRLSQTFIHLGGWLLFSGMALVIFLRRSDDWMTLVGSAMLLVLGAGLFGPLTLLATQQPGWEIPVAVVGALSPADPAFWRSLGGILLLAFAFLFPDGRFVPRFTRPLLVGVLLVAVGWALYAVALDPAPWSGPVSGVWTLGLPLAAVAAQVYRYLRISDDEVRQQTRLVVLALAAVVGTFVVLWVLKPELGQGVFELVLDTPRLEAIYDFNLLALLTIAVFLLPVALAVSVIRYRLWDIDLILNQALVYGALTGFVAVVFLAGLVIFGQLLNFLFVAGSGAGLAGVVTGVVMMVVAQPLRRRTQTSIDRRFYREKYNADRTVDAFEERIRDEVAPLALETDLLGVVQTTLHPSSVRLWLRHRAGGFPASDPFWEELSALRAPIHIAELEPDSAVVGLMREEDEVLAVPLIGQGELVGALVLGARLGNRPYSGLDRQFLANLAGRAAPALRVAEMVARQEAEAASRQRVEHELAIARRIQRDLLPKQLPELDGWALAAHYEPAREVGGDFYDFIDLEDGRWGIVIGDVADKGIPAAMVMATCRTVLRGVAQSRAVAGPGLVLQRANELLIPDLPSGMFVTCLYGVLDPPTGRFVFANAGHNLPCLRTADGVIELWARGMPLGLMPGMDYEERGVVLQPGTGMLLSSDGIAEAHDPDGAMFGVPRLMALVGEHPGGPSLIEAVLADLGAFAGPDWEQEDDVTLVTIVRE